MYRSLFIRSKFRSFEKVTDYSAIMVLSITNVTEHDLGTYSCISSSSLGKDTGSMKIYGKMIFKKIENNFVLHETKNL